MLDLLVDVDAAVTLCFHANLLPSAWPQLSGILDENRLHAHRLGEDP